MTVNLSLIVELVYDFARLLLEVGAALALAGALASLLAIVLTWRPAQQRRRAALAYRAEAENVIAQTERGSARRPRTSVNQAA